MLSAVTLSVTMLSVVALNVVEFCNDNRLIVSIPNVCGSAVKGARINENKLKDSVFAPLPGKLKNEIRVIYTRLNNNRPNISGLNANE
jgi:hypothetical protein